MQLGWGTQWRHRKRTFRVKQKRNQFLVEMFDLPKSEPATWRPCALLEVVLEWKVRVERTYREGSYWRWCGTILSTHHCATFGMSSLMYIVAPINCIIIGAVTKKFTFYLSKLFCFPPRNWKSTNLFHHWQKFAIKQRLQLLNSGWMTRKCHFGNEGLQYWIGTQNNHNKPTFLLYKTFPQR